MRGLRPVNAAWKVPTILTDASPQIELLRHLWPDMKLAGDIAVEARHQHIRQIIDRSYGLSSLDASDPAIADPGPEGEEKIRRTRKAERARRRRALCDVHARLHREARLAAPGILLAVAQQRIRRADRGHRPAAAQRRMAAPRRGSSSSDGRRQRRQRSRLAPRH